MTTSGGIRRIWVDADACPVKGEIASAALAYPVEVWMVASYNHAPQDLPGVRQVQVDSGDQAVDLYIANRIAPGDILVTQDFGLAAIGLGKRAQVLSNRGQVYTNENIDFLLARRHDHARKRRGGKHTRGPRPMTREDRMIFQQGLTNLLEAMQEN